MSKVSQEDLVAFGVAVTRARSLLGWTLDQLGAALDPPVGKSFVSKVEKGQKDTLNPRTVGRFIKALSLDEALIDNFIGVDTTADGDETATERDADKMVLRLDREGKIGNASEELLIGLANRYAVGDHRDLESAYQSVVTALDAAERIRIRGEMPADNTGSQLNAVLAEVAKLNAAGRAEDADDLLDAEEKRMKEAHQNERDRMDQAAKALLDRRIDQDRVLNQPEVAGKRLIQDLRRQAPAGGVYRATAELGISWRTIGDEKGDLFMLNVALFLAKTNHQRAKGLQKSITLNHLGHAHLSIATRSVKRGHLKVARNAFEAELSSLSKTRDTGKWRIAKASLTLALSEAAKREKDLGLLREVVDARRELCEQTEFLEDDIEDDVFISRLENLGLSLISVAEIESQISEINEGVSILEKTLNLRLSRSSLRNKVTAQNNLAYALKVQGLIMKDSEIYARSRDLFAECEHLHMQLDAPFILAMVHWNIGDLSLARHTLDPNPEYLSEARTYVTKARDFFIQGSDYQTQRCDDLIAKIDAAEAA